MIGRALRRVRGMVHPWTELPGPRSSEGHRPEGSWLRESVFGANDGLVSNVALVSGIAGGTGNADIILLGGVAGLVAGAISMALGAYISTKSEREFRDAEEARERWEIEHMREQELAETRQIFQLKGITGPLLDEIVDVVSRDHDQWIHLMMTDELGFPREVPRPVASAVIMGLAFAVAAFFPVAPYVFAEGSTAFGASLALSGVALFGIGAMRAWLTTGSLLFKGLEMVVLATAAVGVAFAIGQAVQVSV